MIEEEDMVNLLNNNPDFQNAENQPEAVSREVEAEHFAAGSDSNFRTAHKAGFLAGYAKAEKRIAELTAEVNKWEQACYRQRDERHEVELVRNTLQTSLIAPVRS